MHLTSISAGALAEEFSITSNTEADRRHYGACRSVGCGPCPPAKRPSPIQQLQAGQAKRLFPDRFQLLGEPHTVSIRKKETVTSGNLPTRPSPDFWHESFQTVFRAP